MQDNLEIIKAYEELQACIDKHKDSFTGDHDVQAIKGTIKRLNLEQRFGMPLRNTGVDWYEVYLTPSSSYVGYYDEDENNRRIPWSDDGQQPNKEWLFQVCFPTGPYIFGQHYPKDTFQEFFNELKAFGPKYCDTNNKSLYFTEEVSEQVYDAFKGIYRKYCEKVGEEIKRERKKQLEAELAKLNEETK